MRPILRESATNIMHPPVATGRVFRGKLGNLLKEINEQSKIMNQHWNNSDKVIQEQLPHYDYPVRAIAHYAYAVPAMHRRDELEVEAAALIAKALRDSDRGGFNFRNAKPCHIAFLNGVKLYWNDDAEAFADILRSHMPEEVQWIAQGIAYKASAILRKH